MPKNLSIFKTPENQAKYMAAYDAVLALWPVPYESLDIPTRFGKSHRWAKRCTTVSAFACYERKLYYVVS